MGKPPGLALQASIVQDNIPVEVSPRIYVGSNHAAFNIEALFERNITHILNLAGNYTTFPSSFTYLSVSIRDKEYANLLSCLPMAFLFVEAALSHNDTKENGIFIHCVGGRSRSPAVIIAYLMVKHRLDYDEALARIQAVRPVVSLNGGFESQLRCLAIAKGDVFAAHQLVLKKRLRELDSRQEADGLNTDEIPLDCTSRHKVGQDRSEHSCSPHTPKTKPPHVDFEASRDMMSTACDDRGMICSQVPCGLSLSLPRTGPGAQFFIPALRSMGTLYGCRVCGECLFPASAIVTTSQFEEQQCFTEESNRKSPDQSKVNRPLLAKLRLRPQNPVVKRPSDEDELIKFSQTTRDQTATKHFVESVKWQSTSSLPQNYQGFQHISTKANSYENEEASSAFQTNGGKLWRSLTPFKSSRKTNYKSAIEAVNKRKEDKLAPRVAGAAVVDDCDSVLIRNSVFRKSENLWAEKVLQLEKCWSAPSDGESKNTLKSAERLSIQLKSVMSQDTSTLGLLEASNTWYVEPQGWIHNLKFSEPKSSIVCPNKQCGVLVGRWHSHRSMCTYDIVPVFQIDKNAVRILGNVTTLPTRVGGIQNRNGRE